MNMNMNMNMNMPSNLANVTFLHCRFCYGCKIECNCELFNYISIHVAIDWEPTTLHLRYHTSQEKVVPIKDSQTLYFFLCCYENYMVMDSQLRFNVTCFSYFYSIIVLKTY